MGSGGFRGRAGRGRAPGLPRRLRRLSARIPRRGAPGARAGSLPARRRSRRGGGFRRGGARGGSAAADSAQIEPALAYAKAHHPGTRWALIVSSEQAAAPAVIKGESVAAMGGFTGRETVLTSSYLASLVRSGEARYFLLGGRRVRPVRREQRGRLDDHLRLHEGPYFASPRSMTAPARPLRSPPRASSSSSSRGSSPSAPANTRSASSTYVRRSVAGVPYWIAGRVAFAAGAVNGYVLNRRWTFAAARLDARPRPLPRRPARRARRDTGLLWLFVTGGDRPDRGLRADRPAGHRRDVHGEPGLDVRIPSRRAAFSFSTSGRTSSLMPRLLEVGEPAVGRDQRVVRAEQDVVLEERVRVLDELRREVLRRPAGQVDVDLPACAARRRSPRPATGTTGGRA